MIKKWWIALCLFVVVSILCFMKVSKNHESDLELFIKKINNERSQLLQWNEQEKNAVTTITKVDAEYEVVINVADLISPHQSQTTITLEEAERDIEVFFSLLKSAYSGYEYFGGEDVFLPIKAKLLQKSKTYDVIDFRTLEEIIARELKEVIVDGHFVVGTTTFVESQAMYYVKDLYVDKITDQDAHYLRPTIGVNGSLTNAFVALSKDGQDLPKEIILEGKIRQLNWVRSMPYVSATTTRFEEKVIDTIPILISRSMLRNHEEDKKQLEEFSSSASRYQNKEIVVIDIRGNVGGDDTDALTWIEKFTAQPMNRKLLSAQKYSTVLTDFSRLHTGEYSYSSEAVAYLQEKKEGWNVIISDGNFHKNNTTIFVLIDKQVASSAESFVYGLRTVANVILVGTNTKGGYMFGNVCYYLYLPNSGLRVGFGTNINLVETQTNREGTGIEPDIWVNPYDALDAVLRLSKYYGLAN